MTPAQRANIGHGVRIAAMRKRQSEAMKASWVRRRNLNGFIPVAPEPPRHQENLWEVAKVLGIDTDELVRSEIRRVLSL